MTLRLSLLGVLAACSLASAQDVDLTSIPRHIRQEPAGIAEARLSYPAARHVQPGTLKFLLPR